MTTPAYHFPRDFETGGALPVPIGRLDVGGYVIRIIFGPYGLALAIPEQLKDHPNIFWH